MIENKINEETILKILNKLITQYKHVQHTKNPIPVTVSIEMQALEGLLVLYNDVKEENEQLHKEINERIKLKIENEKIVDTEFISKDKIKEIKQKLHRIANGEFDLHRNSFIFVNICNVERDIDELLNGEKKNAVQQIINNEFHCIGYENVSDSDDEINFQNNSNNTNIVFNKDNKTIEKYNWSNEEDAEAITLQELKVILHQIEILKWEI